MTVSSISRLVAACAAAVTLAAGGASADPRPFAPALSCGALQDLVAARGAAVISTSRTTYDRFVSDSRGCYRTQVTEPAWIRSADDRRCFIGYTCREYARDDL
ncbi:hypothetical protein ACFSCV_14490 [Methylopila henanensis]|uniref:Uncharacterized protein n=1 Tax=Methylopila henanensis TaxID=873516 RepID=A0ABW4KAV3_9HYPH